MGIVHKRSPPRAGARDGLGDAGSGEGARRLIRKPTPPTNAICCCRFLGFPANSKRRLAALQRSPLAAGRRVLTGLAGNVTASDGIGIHRPRTGRGAGSIAALAVDIVVIETSLLAGHRIVHAGVLLASRSGIGLTCSGRAHLAAGHRAEAGNSNGGTRSWVTASTPYSYSIAKEKGRPKPPHSKPNKWSAAATLLAVVSLPAILCRLIPSEVP
jgi:hypothetical protein